MPNYTAQVTKHGETELPVELREPLGIRAGDWVTFRLEDGTVIFEKLGASVASVRGIIPTPPHLVGCDIDEMIEGAMSNHADEIMERMQKGLE